MQIHLLDIIGFITENDETAYREEVMVLYKQCLENNPSLNVSKTGENIEMIVNGHISI